MKDFGGLTRSCSGAVPSPAPVRPLERIRMECTTLEIALVSALDVRGSGWHVEGEGVCRERCSLARTGEIVLVELPGAAWHRRKRRGPSTQPCIPFASLRVARFSVGMTGGWIAVVADITVIARDRKSKKPLPKFEKRRGGECIGRTPWCAMAQEKVAGSLHSTSHPPSLCSVFGRDQGLGG